MFGGKLTIQVLLAFGIILFGLLFGSIYSYFHGSGSEKNFVNGYWIIITVISAIPTAFETLFQEYAFKKKKMPRYYTLFIYNLVSLIFYAIWIFATTIPVFGTCVDHDYPIDTCDKHVRACELKEIFPHQLDAIECYFFDSSKPCCSEIAFLWPTLFTIFYVITYSLMAYITEKYSSNEVANGQAITFPLVGIFFWLPPVITSKGSSQFEWWILLALIFVTLGNLLYEHDQKIPDDDRKHKWQQILREFKGKEIFTRESLIVEKRHYGSVNS